MELKGEFALVQNIVETHALFFHDVNFHVFAHPFFKGNFLKVHRKPGRICWDLSQKALIARTGLRLKPGAKNFI